MTDLHPALQPVLDALRGLADYQPSSPQETAALIQGLAGDGSADTDLATELYRIVTRLAFRNPAVDSLPAQSRRYIAEAAWRAEMVATQQAGDYIGQALYLLEDPGTLPAADFYTDFNLPIDDDEQPEPTAVDITAPLNRALAALGATA